MLILLVVLSSSNKLSLSKQNLTELPADWAKNKKLTELDLSYNPIEALPPEIGDMGALESLNLRCTRLKKLPPELTKLTKLKRLDVSSAMDCEDIFHMNKDTAAVIGKLTGLVDLRVAFMHIKTVPPELLKLPLKVLDVSFNELKDAPKAWPAELEDLDLSGNELAKLPDLSGLKKLRKLGVSGQRGKKTIAVEEIQALQKANPKVKIIAD